MTRYERDNYFCDVSVSGSTLNTETSKKRGLFRRMRAVRATENFDTPLDARRAFARKVRELREEGFRPVDENAGQTRALAEQARDKFEASLRLEPPQLFSARAAKEALNGLLELRTAIQASKRGEFFPGAGDVLDGLDPEPRIAKWEDEVRKAYNAVFTPLQLEVRAEQEDLFGRTEVPKSVDEETASRTLAFLFSLRSKRRRALEGEFFPDQPQLLDGLDPEPRIEEWRARLEKDHGEIGKVFFAEISDRCEFPVEGVELRTGRRRWTLRAAPERSERGFGRLSENDAMLLELEEALLGDRERIENYAVYADRLQELGNPLGELIALGLAAEGAGDESAVRDFVEANSAELLGALGEMNREGIELTWRRGFVDRARFDSEENDEIEDGIEALLSCPAGALLRSLEVGMIGDYELDYVDTIELIADGGPHPALAELFLGDFQYPDQIEMSWAVVGNIGELWRALPNLRDLTLQGAEIELGEIRAPELRRLSLQSGGLPSRVLREIGHARWPELEELQLWLGTDEYGADGELSEVISMLTEGSFPKLKTLRLMNSELSDEIAAALGELAITSQLNTIDLSMGTLGQDGAEAIANHIDKFAHLETLDLSDNFLSAEDIARFQEHTFVIAAEQKEDEGEFRYVSVGE